MKQKPSYKDLEKEIEFLRKEKAEICNNGHEEVINTLSDGIYINSPDYIIKYLNKPMIKMLGGDKTGQKCYKAIYNKTKICEWCVFKKLKKKEIITHELQHPVTNNYYTIKNVLLDNGSKVTTYNDNTDIKKIKQALNIEEKNLSNIFEAMTDGVYIVNQQLDILYVNPVLTKDFGNYNGLKCYEYLHNRKSVCTWCNNTEVFKGKTVRWEWYSSKNKRTYDLIDTPIKGIDGNLLKLEIFRDITDLKKTEHSLQKQNEEYAALNEEYKSQNEKILEAKELAEKSDKRHKLVVAATNLGIWDWDVETDTIFYSKLWKKQIGYKENELDNSFATWQNHLHPDEYDETNKKINDYLKNPVGKYISEFRFRHKNGSYIWIQTRSEVLKNEKGDIIRMFGSHRDITARKRVEQDLQKEKNMAQKYFNVAGVMFIVLNKKGDITLINKKGCEILGYAHDEIINKNWFDLCVPENIRNEIFSVFQKLMNGEINPVEYYENKVIANNNKIKLIAFHNTIIKNSESQITNILFSGEDITEQKKAEAELIKLNTAIEKSINEVYIFDAENLKFSYANNGAIQNIGYTLEELNSMTPADLKPNYSIERFNKIILPLKNGERNNLQFETIHQRKDKSQYPIDINLSKFIDNDRMFFLALIIDITEQKKTEQELIVAKERAEESDQLKTEFFNNMSHEIRTPMNGILGFSKFLNKENLSHEKRKKYVDIVQSSGKQLLHIIDDILEMSKLGAKQVDVIEEQICLNELIEEQFTFFDSIAKLKNIALYHKKGLSDKDCTIVTDKEKLNKILNNLLENALKYTFKGFIEFGYKIIKPDDSPYHLVEIYVKDTGIGIKQENQEIIFKRFSQEEKELSKKVGGLGLGLSIANENALLLGGKITLESEKGTGTTFFITIPYKPANKQQQKTKEQQSAISNPQTHYQGKVEKTINKYTILIAEDEKINFQYLKTVLEDFELNIKTLRAKHGIEAIDICKKNTDIDIVLMDLKMPIMSGFDATKQIKEFRPNLPIIAQTAYTSDEEKNEAYKSGCDGFISKPTNEETLKNIINKFLK